MKAGGLIRLFALSGLQLITAVGANNGGDALEKCPGYKASNVKTTSHDIKADLHLAGAKCNAYGKDLDNLKLDVTVETCEYIASCISFHGPTP